ncbi:DUF2147 domain-containing protein [uncultured Sphingomonas sp.]|uniref:DUF2147 domain-containing protein n=1 Tax=uncultured Sphingomonas sp. TaxID=158754 RepID=UPI0035CA9EBF
MKLRNLLIAMAAIAAPIVASAKVPRGVWANPSNSVHVTFVACGAAMCGRVIWASDKAKADAAKGTGKPLVGSMLFRDFVEQAPGQWVGTVLVPDIGQTLSGTIRQVDARTLRGEGCLFAGIGCRIQTWRRIG